MSIISRDGRTLVRRRIDGSILGVSPDGSFVLLRQKPVVTMDGLDVVALDRQLNEAWRLRGAYRTQAPQYHPNSGLLVVAEGKSLRAYAVENCKGR